MRAFAIDQLGGTETRTVRLEDAGQALAEIAGRHVRGKLGARP